MLIPDLADKLLQNILQRHQANGAAEFIHHDGDMKLLLLQFLAQVRDFLALGNVNDRLDDRLDALFAAERDIVEVLEIHDADDVVDAVLIHRQT